MAGENDLKAQIVIEAQDQASAVFKNLAGSLGQLGGAFQSIAGLAGPVGIAVGALATGLGAVVSVGKGVADQVEQLDLLATRTGVSSEALQVLQRQIVEMGGNTESLTQALTFLNRSIATGDPLLAQLGVTSKDTLTAFKQLSTAFSASDDTAKKTEIAYRLLGRGSAELLGILPQLAGGFDATRASMEAAGGVLSGSVLEAARQLDAEADKLNSSWANLMTKMKAATLPTAIAVTQALNDMWDAMTGNKQSADEVAARRIGALQQQIASNQQFISAAQKRGATPAFLQEYQDLVAKLQLELGKLQGIRADTEEAEEDMLSADLARSRVKDTVSDAKLETAKKVEKSPREQEIERIKRALQVLRPEAEQTYDALQRLADVRFAQGVNDLLQADAHVEAMQAHMAQVNASIDTMQELFGGSREAAAQMVAKLKEAADERERLAITSQLNPELAATNLEIDKMATLFGGSREKAEEMVKALREIGDERQRQQILNQLGLGQAITPGDIVQKWSEAIAEMQDLATVVDDTFGGLFSGLEQGFNTAFQNILTGSQSVGEAIKGIWSSVVSSILSELARLAAVAVFKQILGFFTGGSPIAGVLPGQGLGDLPLPNIQTPVPDFSIRSQPPPDSFAIGQRPAPEPVNVTVAPPEPVQNEPAPPLGNTFNVYTYDAHTIVADLVSPSGKMRRANDTLAVLGAY